MNGEFAVNIPINEHLNYFIQQEDLNTQYESGITIQYLISMHVIDDQQVINELQSNQQLIFFIQDEYEQQIADNQIYGLGNMMLYSQHRNDYKQRQQLNVVCTGTQIEYLLPIFNSGQYLLIHNKIMDYSYILGQIQLNKSIFEQFSQLEQQTLINLEYVCHSLSNELVMLKICQTIEADMEKRNVIIITDQLKNVIFEYRQLTSIKNLLVQQTENLLVLQLINCMTSNQQQIKFCCEDELEEAFIALSYMGM